MEEAGDRPSTIRNGYGTDRLAVERERCGTGAGQIESEQHDVCFLRSPRW